MAPPKTLGGDTYNVSCAVVQLVPTTSGPWDMRVARYLQAQIPAALPQSAAFSEFFAIWVLMNTLDPKNDDQMGIELGIDCLSLIKARENQGYFGQIQNWRPP